MVLYPRDGPSVPSASLESCKPLKPSQPIVYPELHRELLTSINHIAQIISIVSQIVHQACGQEHAPRSHARASKILTAENAGAHVSNTTWSRFATLKLACSAYQIRRQVRCEHVIVPLQDLSNGCQRYGSFLRRCITNSFPFAGT